MKRLMSMVLLLAAVTAIPAAASTFLAMSRGDLVRESGAVVQGEVLKVSSFWSPRAGSSSPMPWSRWTRRSWAKLRSVVVVRTFGGTVGGYHAWRPTASRSSRSASGFSSSSSRSGRVRCV